MNKVKQYRELQQQLAALLEGETDFIANMANTAALLYQSLPDCNWIGFYLHKDSQLVLGPFQGKPACVRIDIGKGVCGTAAQRRQTVIVADVHQFEGHIACDIASQSEIVVPMLANNKLLGVLDLDSPLINRFDNDDRQGLEPLVNILLEVSAV